VSWAVRASPDRLQAWVMQSLMAYWKLVPALQTHNLSFWPQPRLDESEKTELMQPACADGGVSRALERGIQGAIGQSQTALAACATVYGVR
jgi:hypothetical protein